MTTDIKKTPAAAILVAWLIVGIPAAWGIYNTALNAKKIFAAPPPATSTTTPTTTAK
jgi:hypothetical protein